MEGGYGYRLMVSAQFDRRVTALIEQENSMLTTLRPSSKLKRAVGEERWARLIHFISCVLRMHEINVQFSRLCNQSSFLSLRHSAINPFTPGQLVLNVGNELPTNLYNPSAASTDDERSDTHTDEKQGNTEGSSQSNRITNRT